MVEAIRPDSPARYAYHVTMSVYMERKRHIHPVFTRRAGVLGKEGKEE